MIPRRIFWLFDLSSILLAAIISYWLVPYLHALLIPGGPLRLSWVEALSPPTGWESDLPPFSNLIWVILTTAPSTLLFLVVLGCYRPLFSQSRTRILFGGLVAPVAGLSLITLVLFALKNPGWSRLFIFSFTILSAFVLIVYRLVLRSYFVHRRATGYYAKNVVLVGMLPAIRWMERYFAENTPVADYRLLGYLDVFSNRERRRSKLATPNNDDEVQLTRLGSVSELGDLLIHRPAHEVIAIQPSTDAAWITGVIQDCDHLGILLRIVPEALLLGETRRLRTLYPFQTLHLPAVVLAPPHWDSDELFVKRLFDILLSSILLVLLAPILFLIALAVKLTSPGLPIFYRWRVVGRNGVEFTGYKFTTMAADADERKKELMDQNEMVGPVFKMKKDPRITPLGRFLRKYSLNELPQLWSVLRGDMSLVGPRPAFRHELERYEFWQKRKLSINPGITCLWQIRGRNSINNFDDWVRMDLEYIDHWSLWLDLKILMRTAWVVIAGTGS